MGGKSFKDILWKIFRFVFLGFMALISVGPLVWIVMSSFKSNKEILSSAFALPTSLSFNGYKAALDLAPIFKFYGNSVVISFTSSKAIDCLMVHPLVNSYSLAKKLVETYLATNKDYMEEWN